ncbi:asparaginase [Candidatus Woesearchaeota archaeon]|nr:asparaginase [Candidatus Woesearchaeota archaeon]
MVQEPLEELLRGHLAREKRPVRFYILNTGGTITSMVDEEGHLTPAQSEQTLRSLIMDMLGFRDYTSSGLLDVRINHLFAIDSSQMQNSHRQAIVAELREKYTQYDGAIILHGTDTGDRTAKFVALALPYYDPIALWQGQRQVLNFCKPVVVVSSQIPLLNERGMLRIDSDGMMNFVVAANIIAQGEVGESGILANKEDAIRGTAATKGSETELPVYLLDKGVPSIGRYASDGIHYTTGAYLKKKIENELKKPLSMENVVPYENKVLVVFDSQHLSPLKDYFRAKETGNHDVERFLKDGLPEIIIYVSKGAGNVDGKDYSILEKATRELDLSIFRVPIPGGRIPDRQIYAVPGHDLPAVNMQPTAAEYKAMMTLSLADNLGVERTRRREFIRYMMTEKWGNEILPPRFTI